LANRQKTESETTRTTKFNNCNYN